MATERQVTAVTVRADAVIGPRSITWLHGPGWNSRRTAEVVNDIDSRSARYFTYVNGYKAYLETVYEGGSSYVRTTADTTTVNNLLRLPRVPAPVLHYTRY